jgi:hypothetical protein
MKTNFGELTSAELWQLRNEIMLNSLYVADYTNSFGFNASDVSDFFDGYMEYIYELMNEDNAPDDRFNEYDNEWNLYDWFCCYEDFTWVRFEGYGSEDEEDDYNSIYL